MAASRPGRRPILWKFSGKPIAAPGPPVTSARPAHASAGATVRDLSATTMASACGLERFGTPVICTVCMHCRVSVLARSVAQVISSAMHPGIMTYFTTAPSATGRELTFMFRFQRLRQNVATDQVGCQFARPDPHSRHRVRRGAKIQQLSMKKIFSCVV